MADTDEKLTGPDLTQPVPISSVPRGGMIGGWPLRARCLGCQNDRLGAGRA